MKSSQLGLFAKMSPASLEPETTLLDASSLDSLAAMPRWFRQDNKDGGPVVVWSLAPNELPVGGFCPLNTTVCHNDAVAFSWPAILSTGSVPPKYLLSPKALAGNLRIEERTGLKLHPQLVEAFTKAAGTSGPAKDLSQGSTSTTGSTTP